MQSLRDEVHISPAEWRWVILFSGILILLAFAPFLWVAFSGFAASKWQFMGVFNNYLDGATYLSKMLQGVEGSWLIQFRHTPETQYASIFFGVLYTALGHLSRLINLQPIAMFHVARVIASLIMYMALYYLGATIWPHKLRSRRIFFTLAAVGSGLGWFFVLFTGETSFPDFSIPEIFPFYSSLVNVHFPLTLACMALLCSVLIENFQPGMKSDPDLTNGGLIICLLSFAISLLYPQALVPMIVGLGLCGLLQWRRQKRITLRELRWWLVLVLPALPVAAYYAAVATYNPAASQWIQQNVTPSPPIVIMFIGLGVPLLMALPGIYHALRYFDQDGDQFVLIWLVTIFIVAYLPTSIQRRFTVGLMIPIAYFATRALDNFWLQRISRPWRYRLLIAVFPVITISQILPLISSIPTNPASAPIGPFLERDYTAVFQWLTSNTHSDDVILAAPEVSVWIPGWVGARVVYGHPLETLQADVKEAEVLHWYAGEATTVCNALLSEYAVKYVIVGPEEKALGDSNCLSSLTPVFTYHDITVYAP